MVDSGIKYADFDGSTWTTYWADKRSKWPNGTLFSFSSIGISDNGDKYLVYPVYDGGSWTNMVFYDMKHQYKKVVSPMYLSSGMSATGVPQYNTFAFA